MMVFFLIALIVILSGLLVYFFATDHGRSMWDRIFGGKEDLTDLTGEDSLASAKDLGAERVSIPKDSHTVSLGWHIDSRTASRVRRDPESNGSLVVSERNLPTLVLGSPGSGKTSSVLVSNLLTWGNGKSPVLAASVKHDLVRSTIRLRKKLGKVYLFDPEGNTPAQLRKYLAMWTPLTAAQTWKGAVETASALVFASSSDTPGDEFWKTQSTSLLAVIMFITASQPGTSMNDVVDSLGAILAPEKKNDEDSDSGMAALTATLQDRASELRSLRRSAVERATTESVNAITETAELDKLDRQLDDVHAALQTLKPLAIVADTAPQTIGGVIASCANVLAVYRSARDHATATWDDPNLIDIDSFLDGPDTIYIVAPPRKQELYAPILAAFASTVISRAYEKAQVSPGETLPHPLLACLDEIHAMPINDLPALFATARSYGLTFLVATQSYSQLVEKFTEDGASTILSSSASVLVLPRTKDPKTLDVLSKISGEVRVKNESTTTSTSKSREKGKEETGKSEGTSESTTVSWEYRPLLPPGRIAAMADGEAFAIVGSSRTQLLLRFYFRSEYLSKLAEGDLDGLNMTDSDAITGLPYMPEGDIVQFSDSQGGS